MKSSGDHRGEPDTELRNLVHPRPRHQRTQEPVITVGQIADEYRRNARTWWLLGAEIVSIVLITLLLLIFIPGDYRAAVLPAMAVVLGGALVRPAKSGVARRRREPRPDETNK
jgi:hypothetical protein